MVATNTPTEYWPKLLCGYFSNVDDANWWLRQLPTMERNWLEAQRLFLAHFVHPNARQHRFDQLMTFTQRTGESLQQYSDRFMNDMAIAKACATDRSMINTFRRGIRDHDVRNFVDVNESLRAFPFDSVQQLSEAAVTGEALLDRRRHDSRLSAQRRPEASSPSGNRILCRQCNQIGHIAAKCPQNTTTAHRKDDRVSASVRPPKPDLSKIQCHRCPKNGHYANECPNVKVTRTIAVDDGSLDESSGVFPEESSSGFLSENPDHDDPTPEDELAPEDDPAPENDPEYDNRDLIESPSGHVLLFDNVKIWHTKLVPEEPDPEIAPVTVPLIVEFDQGSTVSVLDRRLVKSWSLEVTAISGQIYTFSPKVAPVPRQGRT
jgi:hypothetical protein